jgi:hypothetical protein
MMRRRSGQALTGFGLLVLVVALWALPHAAAQVTARTPALQITLFPSEAALAVGESTHVLLVAQSSSTEPVSAIRIFPGSSELVTITSPAQIPDLAPGASESVDLTVTRVAEGSSDAVGLEVHVEYSQGADLLPQVVSASFSVKAVAPPTLATGTLDGVLDPVSEDRPGTAVLTITNTRSTPTSITRLSVTAPRSVTAAVPIQVDGETSTVKVMPEQTVDVLRDTTPILVPARSSVVVPIGLSASGSLDPGQRTIAVQLTAVEGMVTSAGDTGGKPAQDIVVTKDLKVEVFGESQILGALGVPMLLLLPGLIIITTTLVLLKTLGPWRGNLASSSPDLTKASFATVASVFISLLVALAYPTLTDLWPGDSRNLRKGYGFSDFYYVYLWSFLIAVVAWVLLCLAKPALDKLFRVDPGNDDASTILRKLSFRYARTSAPVVTIQDGATPPTIALHVGSVGDKWLVVPPVNAKFKATETAARDELAQYLEGHTRLWHGWWKLRKAVKAGKVETVSFEPTPFVGPALTAPDKTLPTGQGRKALDVM